MRRNTSTDLSICCVCMLARLLYHMYIYGYTHGPVKKNIKQLTSPCDRNSVCRLLVYVYTFIYICGGVAKGYFLRVEYLSRHTTCSHLCVCIYMCLRFLELPCKQTCLRILLWCREKSEKRSCVYIEMHRPVEHPVLKCSVSALPFEWISPHSVAQASRDW